MAPVVLCSLEFCSPRLLQLLVPPALSVAGLAAGKGQLKFPESPWAESAPGGSSRFIQGGCGQPGSTRHCQGSLLAGDVAVSRVSAPPALQRL